MSASLAASPRVLILTASTGNGHISASRSLVAACQAQGIEAQMTDALDCAPRGFRIWYAGGYENAVKLYPALWGLLYHDSDHYRPSFYLQSVLDSVFLPRLEALVRSFQPDWVLCTHSLPQPRLEQIRAKGARFKMGIVVTDLHPHLMWLRGKPDAYFVPGALSKERLSQRLKRAAPIFETGIPIHPAFALSQTQAEARSKANLPLASPLILISSGGIGGGPIEKVFGVLANLSAPARFAFICGRNEALRERLGRLHASLSPERQAQTHILGHISQEEMATLMRASDLLIGKPGGLTSAECMASGLPMLLFKPLIIPGQEEDNARFLAQEGAATLVKSPDQLLQQTSALLTDSATLAQMRQKANRLAKPHAAEEIVRLIRTL